MVDTFGRNDVILKPNGNKITRKGIVNEGESFYEAQYQEKLSDICDFGEGSEIRTLHESFAVELFSLYKEMYRMAKMKFVLDSENTYLDRLGCEYHLRRKQARVATGSVTFSTDETLTTAYTIPSGTIILSRDKGYEYVLDENVTIESSSTPVNGTVHSKLTGSRFNASENTLTAFQDINGIRRNIKVTNSSPITGGEDSESDESFRRRILNAKKEKSWGTATVYDNFIKENVAGVHDIQFVPSEVLQSDSKYPPHYRINTDIEAVSVLAFNKRKEYYCTDCTRVLFVNGYVKPVESLILQEVDTLMTQQNNLVIGQLFHIQEAQTVPVHFKIELYCMAEVSEDVIYTHLNAFFNGGTVETKVGDVEYRGLNISESIYKFQLLNVLENIPGVEQCLNIMELNFYSNIPSGTNEADMSKWADNGDNSYTHVDDEGFVYHRQFDSDTVNKWGERNFTSIDCEYGQVLDCVPLKDTDENNDNYFDLTETIIVSS